MREIIELIVGCLFAALLVVLCIIEIQRKHELEDLTERVEYVEQWVDMMIPSHTNATFDVSSATTTNIRRTQ